LGASRSSARSYQQSQIRGIESARPRLPARPSFGRRPVALRRLRDARKWNSVRPFIRGEEKRSCVIRRVTARRTSCASFCRSSASMLGSKRGRAAGPCHPPHGLHLAAGTSTGVIHTSPVLAVETGSENIMRGVRKKQLAKRWGVRFFTGELRSQQCIDEQSGLPAEDIALGDH
jgi:hypothetical protein